MGEAKTVVVTGGNRGIGQAVAQLAAAGGHRVVVVSRGAAVDGFAHVTGDLSAARTTRAAAAAIAAACPRVDVLVHNAGIWPSRLARNEDGFEQAWFTNHLAPFLLNHLLEDRVGRVVQVSAGLYVKGAVDPARTPVGDDFHAIRTYAGSKLANVLMLPLFAERWRAAGRTIDAVHPGVIRTGLGDRGGPVGLLLKAVKLTWATPEAGARNVVRLLDDTGGTGRYFVEEREVPIDPAGLDAGLARRLWDDAARVLDVA
ncbi:SDR family NAD(P)-dependent oxidoreductase [Dactylosporangium sp. AC04546]|uniref:SDR family NAD(P)-dependent oxidoreductase n=1 Tax=Dactylosporangium sp. AC04546 TaxID=2862460 RepID=UPI001EDDB32F|nr:SDR family NAD(P)-dependent oxidoreductase [Dactylosporangium sp. AC04546]WVK81162.1 SDR family NAD(P)-dependent oxidoreductase [Dactylosporangium sp. AC04546]